MPSEFGNRNSVWKRFWRLSRSAPVIPRRENSEQRGRFFPKRLDERQTRIEQTIGKLTRFERVAMRCEKTDTSYSAIISFACGLMLDKSVHGLVRGTVKARQGLRERDRDGTRIAGLFPCN